MNCIKIKYKKKEPYNSDMYIKKIIICKFDLKYSEKC